MKYKLYKWNELIEHAMQVQQTINLKDWKRSFSKMRNGKL